MKHVVIAGGGFGGIRLARKLKKQKDITVTLINNSPDFRYYPAIYRAATGFKLGTVRLPLEWMLLDSSRTKLIIDSVTGIDEHNKRLKLKSGQVVDYDIVVFALGAVTTYFNIEGVHEHSFGIKSMDEIVHLRNHLHEKINHNTEADENYVIVGGGPTGVEVASGFGAYVKQIAKKHRAKNHRVKVWLVEGKDRILPQMSEKASRAAAKQLRKYGVKLVTNTSVNRESIHSLNTSDGVIKTNTVIWTAGTANNPFFSKHPDIFSLNDRGKVTVNEQLMINDNTYVIGDNAATRSSGLALTAVQHANFVAKDIRARINNSSRPKIYESSAIAVIPVGHKWALLQYKKLVVWGRLVSTIRSISDYIGYSDVLGYLKAMTIWSNGEVLDDNCDQCFKRS